MPARQTAKVANATIVRASNPFISLPASYCWMIVAEEWWLLVANYRCTRRERRVRFSPDRNSSLTKTGTIFQIAGMADTAAHLVDRVFPRVPVRQWVLSLPYALRYRLGYDASLVGDVLAIFTRTVFASLMLLARDFRLEW